MVKINGKMRRQLAHRPCESTFYLKALTESIQVSRYIERRVGRVERITRDARLIDV